ncbi:kinase-like domain-containing protein [Cristinia sonorae]|uniref:Kinase-like domain-containing protein n=1 Tax=Cristinia sonorae TaxID=1940300 RepID=A0A8K0UIH6_9AGAR|nr:kinase-like domain-containing protein [Cristinia sonorae]
MARVYSVATRYGVNQYIEAALAGGDHTEVLPLSSPDDAMIVLDEIWKVLDSAALPRGSQGTHFYTYRNQLRRLSLKVAITYERFPTGLVLTAVRCDDQNQRGAGGFADVYCGTYNGAKVALKRLRTFIMRSESQRSNMKKAFYRESLLWRHLVHENIVSFLGVSEDVFPGTVCMVLPWMDRGSLRHYIDDQKTAGRLNDKQLLAAIDKWLHQTALGLEYLHSEGIVHGDLHAGNILVNDNEVVCLTDFGMALISEGTGYNYGSIHGGGATRWTAPELIDPEAFGLESTRPTFPSDIYSFAMTAVELYTGQPPFPDVNDRQVSRKVVGGLRPPRPVVADGIPISDAIWSLLQSCWSEKIATRPISSVVVEALKFLPVAPNRKSKDAAKRAVKTPANATPVAPVYPPSRMMKTPVTHEPVKAPVYTPAGVPVYNSMTPNLVKRPVQKVYKDRGKPVVDVRTKGIVNMPEPDPVLQQLVPQMGNMVVAATSTSTVMNNLLAHSRSFKIKWKVEQACMSTGKRKLRRATEFFLRRATEIPKRTKVVEITCQPHQSPKEPRNHIPVLAYAENGSTIGLYRVIVEKDIVGAYTKAKELEDKAGLIWH